MIRGSSNSLERLRPATVADLDFVLRIFDQDVQAGHYNACYLDPQKRAEFRISLEQLLRYGVMVRVGTEGAQQLSARLFIFELRAGYSPWFAKGFLYVTERKPGSGEQSVEIYMASIVPAERGKGLGSRMIAAFQALRPEGSELFGRCYPASKRMARIFLNRGFRQTGERLPDGTRHYVYKTPVSAPVAAVRAVLPAGLPRRETHV